MSSQLMKMFRKPVELLTNNRGQGLVEYALILVLIAIVVTAMIKGVGTTTSSAFSTINSSVRN